MTERWTPRKILDWAVADFTKRGIESPRVDAECLIAEGLNKSRVELYLDLDRPLNEDERARIRALVERRRRHEPVAYILGHRDFYKARFKVGPGVLIPRPDTEIVVEEALRRLIVSPPEHRGEAERARLTEPAPSKEMELTFDSASDAPLEPSSVGDIRILDLCAGSGAIGLSILLERPNARAVLTDLSAEALAIARENAEALGLMERVEFYQGDLFEPIPTGMDFDLIVSNPPYIPAGELAGLAPDIRDFEPRLALDGGDDGLDLHRRIAEEAARFLKPGGSLIVEGGAGQAAEIQALHRAHLEGAEPKILRDYGGIERVVSSTLPRHTA